MNQSFIDAIMHFLSLVFLPLPGRNYDDLSLKIREYVDKAGIIINEDECLKIFNNYSEKYKKKIYSHDTPGLIPREKIHLQILAEAGSNAQQNLYLKERFLIVLALLEFSELNYKGDKQIREEILRLAENLNLQKSDFNDASDFITNRTDVQNRNLLILEEDQHLSEDLEGSWIEKHNQENERTNTKGIFQRIRGKLVFRYFSRFNLLVFRYIGTKKLFVNNKPVYTGYFYSLDNNDLLNFKGLDPIHPEEILQHFKLSRSCTKINLRTIDLAFKYSDTDITVKPFSVNEESGKLIGIIGNNGVGKSTILKLIAGHLKPSQGNIYINDTDLIKENFKLQSVIGFVSHRDMIFPELTIYDNLKFQAVLSLGNFTKTQIKERIEEVISKFGIPDIANVRVKDLNSREFSEYQRKCVNIGFEMLRDPLILCLDEPLTGLSYSDAKRLMSLLKEEVYAGKLVVMTVHLPTLEIYKFYDRIWLIDYEGHLIYSGEPKNVYSYLNNTRLIPYHLRDKDPEEVSPEEIINLIETRKIDPDGRISNERLIKPDLWYDRFRKKETIEVKAGQKTVKAAPVSVSGIPGIEMQFWIYFYRNCKQLVKDWRGILINLVGIPGIGVVLALMLKQITDGNYSFEENIFLPLYIFFIVNYMMFSGLLTAADGIYKERPNIYRDIQMNLSLFSYLNAKILFIFLISLIQIMIIVFTGHGILEIKGMAYHYILILFGVSAFANLLALNLSSAVRSLSSVYLLIPFILIPGFIYCGFLIRFDNYNQRSEYEVNIPVAAEFVPSRWAYEALIVSQFKDNSYNSYFFNMNFSDYQDKFNNEKVIPLLESTLEKCRRQMGNADSLKIFKENLSLLKNEFELLDEREGIAPFESIEFLNSDDFAEDVYENTFGYLSYLKFQIENSLIETNETREMIIRKIQDSLISKSLRDFAGENHNKFIENLVYGSNPEGNSQILKDHILKSGSPVYLYPESNIGRAVFFSPVKRFNKRNIDSFRFNLYTLWILNLLLYFLLISDSSRRIFNFFRSNKLDNF